MIVFGAYITMLSIFYLLIILFKCDIYYFHLSSNIILIGYIYSYYSIICSHYSLYDLPLFSSIQSTLYCL